MSAKDCGHHGDDELRKLYRRFFAFVLLLIILVLFIVLLIYLVLRPSKPSFLLQDLSLKQLNLSSPSTNILFTLLQITLSSRNSNDRIGIYYDKLDVYADYKGQPITTATLLPAGYQGHHDVLVWSPYLVGTAVPVSPYLAVAISQDEAAGYLLLYVKVDGRIRWKVGTWISGTYHLQVSCPALLAVDGGNTFKFRQAASCSVGV